MGEIDELTKDYMRDRTHFADVFNYFLYDGRKVLRPELLHEQDTDELILPYRGKGKPKTVERFRDVLKRACIMNSDRNATYVLLGIENQSRTHYAAPVKTLLYDAVNYGRQVEAFRAAHKAADDKLSSSEFLSGLEKGDRLLPVITLMIYWSADEWDGPLSLHDTIDFTDDRIKNLVADYKLNLITPSMIDDFDKFDSELGEVLEYIKCSGDKETLIKLVNGNPRFQSMDRRSADLINAVTNSKLKFPDDKEASVDVCKAIIQIQDEAKAEGEKQGFDRGEKQGFDRGEKQGFAKGEKQGFAKGEKQGIEKGVFLSVKNLMESRKWTALEAMDALRVPEEDRAHYMAML